jgi:SAM-dependent methyltransferase
MCACRSDHLLVSRDRLHGIPGTFSYRRCTSCRTVFQDPRISEDEISCCYPEDYHTHFEATAEAAAPGSRVAPGLRDLLRTALLSALRHKDSSGSSPLGRLLASSRRLRERAHCGLPDEVIPRLKHPGRSLDVGCGNGELMAKLRSLGWDAEGHDVDPAAMRAATRRTGLPVTNSPLDTLPASAYSLVTLVHVLEHVADPKSMLRAVSRLLRPGGILYLAYPNPASLGLLLFGECWFHLDPPRHVVLPSLRAVTVAAQSAGLQPLRGATSADRAKWAFAASQAYRRGLRHEDQPTTRFLSALGLGEAFLVSMGLPCGEEVLASFKKASDE